MILRLLHSDAVPTNDLDLISVLNKTQLHFGKQIRIYRIQHLHFTSRTRVDDDGSTKRLAAPAAFRRASTAAHTRVVTNTVMFSLSTGEQVGHAWKHVCARDVLHATLYYVLNVPTENMRRY